MYTPIRAPRCTCVYNSGRSFRVDGVGVGVGAKEFTAPCEPTAGTIPMLSNFIPLPTTLSIEEGAAATISVSAGPGKTRPVGGMNKTRRSQRIRTTDVTL